MIKPAHSAFSVEGALERRYRREKGWVVVDEVTDSANCGRGDLVAIQCWSRPFAVGHEIKVSRADWLREAADPTKKEWADFCRLRWFVAPRGVILPEELPTGWGLLEVTGGKSPKVRRVRAAPAREVAPIGLWLTRVLLRLDTARSGAQATVRALESRINGAEENQRLQKLAEREGELRKAQGDFDREKRQLEQTWRDLVQCAGVKTSYYTDAARLSAADLYQGMTVHAAERVLEQAKRAKEMCDLLVMAAETAKEENTCSASSS